MCPFKLQLTMVVESEYPNPPKIWYPIQWPLEIPGVMVLNKPPPRQTMASAKIMRGFQYPVCITIADPAIAAITSDITVGR